MKKKCVKETMSQGLSQGCRHNRAHVSPKVMKKIRKIGGEDKTWHRIINKYIIYLGIICTGNPKVRGKTKQINVMGAIGRTSSL